MYKKTLTYTDFNGTEVTEDLYFNLSKAELTEMNLSTKGGLVARMQAIAASDDGAILVSTFKDLVLRAYGVKSADGRRFIKTPELREEFTQTNAYSEFFMLLATDDKEAADFMNNVVPNNLEPEDHKQKQNLPLPNAPLASPVIVDPEAEAAAKMNMSVKEYRDYNAWREQQSSGSSS
jgi:hypothetical protein